MALELESGMGSYQSPVVDLNKLLMNRVLAYLLLCLLFVCLTSRVNAQQLFGSLSPVVTNPTNSPVVQTNNSAISVGRIQISYGDLSITNAFNGNLQWSLDKTNFVNAGPTFRPAFTNASTEVINPQTVTLPLYFRMAAGTNSWNTGGVSLGGQYTSPN